jgi:hypothetical protein
MRLALQGQERTLSLSARLEIVEDDTLRDVDSGDLSKRVARVG